MHNAKVNRLLKPVLIFLLIGLMTSCNQEEEVLPASPIHSSTKIDFQNNVNKSNFFYGPAKPLGNGVARAWVEVSKEGTPLAVGVNISEKASEKLPHESLEFELELPKQASLSPFTHVGMGWNPHGHEPDHFYGKPHFDFHFYMISEKDRLAIPGVPPPAMDLAPEEKYLPSMYLQIPGVEAAMGVHWVDLLSPEFSPEGTFAKTFIYGTYDGVLTFYEPMITLEYLFSKPNEQINIRQPMAFQKSGYYPLSYGISYSDSQKEYSISLQQLTPKQAE